MKSATVRHLFSGILFLLTGAVYAQTAGSTASKSQHPNKVILSECERGDKCGTWTFLWTNGKGYGKWQTGEEAVLELEVKAEGKIVIHRTDVSGAKEGLTATYEGTLSDRQLGGKFTSLYQGENGSGFWNASVGAAPPSPPKVMHWCSQHCGTWTLDDGPPFDKPHYGKGPASGSIVVVETFTRESVLMKRTDYGQYPGTAVLTGQLSSDGNSIVNGTITWTYHPCCGTGAGTYQAAWGAAINTVPGSDAERGGQQAHAPPGGSDVSGSTIMGRLAEHVAEKVAGDLLADWIESKLRGDQ